MKAFLQKHILFDHRYGMMPYFWGIALIFFSIQMVVNFHTYPKWVAVVLLLIYAKFYRDSYEKKSFQLYKALVQLSIAVLMVMFSQYGTLFIFFAWQIGSMNITKNRFYLFTALYLIACTIGIGSGYFMHDPLSTYDLAISIFFAVGSPFAARSLRNSYQKRFQLSQNNQRLETIIKQAERGRIAKDLHDNLGQSFSLITLKAELAEKLMASDQEKSQKELQDIAETSRKNLSLVREIVADLNKKTIAEAMTIEGKNLQTANIFMQADNEELSSNWPDQIQNTLASVIKEAVTNILRYSKAAQADFIFSEDTDNFGLIISDNGIGFKKKSEGSFGLNGMSQRLSAMNGKLSIESDHGTKLTITIPKG